jgi:hypothetical protein
VKAYVVKLGNGLFGWAWGCWICESAMKSYGWSWIGACGLALLHVDTWHVHIDTPR